MDHSVQAGTEKCRVILGVRLSSAALPGPLKSVDVEPIELSVVSQSDSEGDPAARVGQQLLDFVAQEALKAQPGERLLGSSEVIESVLGCLKRIEKAQSKNGFTGLVLSVVALVAETTTEVVTQALETVPVKKIKKWCRDTLGQTMQSKRKEAFDACRKKEQKWDHIKSQKI